LTNVKGEERKKRQVIGRQEFQMTLNHAQEIPDIFRRLRARALLIFIRRTGRRRGEPGMILLNNVSEENGYIYIRITLEKKRKGKSHITEVTKKLRLDQSTQPIKEYLEYLQSLNPKPKYLFPPELHAFGQFYGVEPNKGLSGRQIYNIIVELNPAVWPHLFRETRGADIAAQDSTIIGATKVQRELNLEKMETGLAYIRRWAAQEVDAKAWDDEAPEKQQEGIT
jgi:integrase